MSSFNFSSDVRKISDLSAFIDLIRHLGILVDPPKAWVGLKWMPVQTVCFQGITIKMVRKRFWCFRGIPDPHGNTMVQE